MTEEIIIDGVDVSRCKYYSKEHSFTNPKGYCNINLRDCKFVKECEYKTIEALKQENKELKEMLSKEPKAMQAFQIAYSGLKKDNEVLWGMVKDYKTALEEIREIAEKYKDYEGCRIPLRAILMLIDGDLSKN